MYLNPRPRPAHRQSGTSMIEVLIAIVIVVLGLLGLAGLQAHATLADMESFQRAQALVLLQDMVDRLNADRASTATYPVESFAGTDVGVQVCAGTTRERDLCEWSNALLGAAETTGSNKVGAMIGARGCIVRTKADMPREFTVTVAWQGTTSTKAPANTCGEGKYGADEKKRRAMTATVVLACLQNDPTTGNCVTP